MTKQEKLQHLLSEPPPIDPYALLAEQMSKALAEEYDIHNGTRSRVNHAVRVAKDGKQQTLWAIMGFATHQHMERAFAQRREHIVNECVQLHIDVAVYNELNAGKTPEIQRRDRAPIYRRDQAVRYTPGGASVLVGDRDGLYAAGARFRRAGAP